MSIREGKLTEVDTRLENEIGLLRAACVLSTFLRRLHKLRTFFLLKCTGWRLSRPGPSPFYASSASNKH